jgi:HSP20 family protein
MKDGDLSVTLDDRQLNIRGIRVEKIERRAYHQMEIRFGEFATQVEIPSPITPQGIKAEYDDGFLLVTLTKATPRRIKIG